MSKIWNVSSVFAIYLVLVCTGCTMHTSIESLLPISSDKTVVSSKTVYFDTTTLNIAEGSAAVVNVVLSEKIDADTIIKISVVGDSSSIQPISSSLLIPSGALSKPLTLQTVDDFVFTGNRTLQLVLSSDDQSLVAQPSTLTLNITDNDLPTVSFSSSALTVNEGVGTFNLTAQINAVAPNAVTVPLVFTGTATMGPSDDYTVSSSTLNIPVGQTSATITFTIVDDAINESTKTIIVDMGTPINAAVGSPSTFTVTLNDDDLGAFSISGITGASDATADAFLVGGTYPIVNWSAAAGASSYDVTIYASNGTSVVCATMNSVTTSYNFSSCALTGGTTYKASVVANGLGLTASATNNLFSFIVNRAPVANSDGPVRIMKNSAAVTLNVVSGSDASTRGTVADSDPDAGDTFAITAVSATSAGGTVSYTSTTVTYTAASQFTGVDTFTYTLTDNHGATATGTVTIHVMDTYTWTGKVSSNWNVNGNWCGTLTNNQCNGTTGYPNNSSTTSHIAIFDGTCAATGHTCNASINTASQAYGIKLNTGYSGTLTQSAGAGNTVYVGNGGFSQSAGTFAGNNANITMNGDVSLSGGSFTATQTTLVIYQKFTVTNSPTYSANSGTTEILSSTTITPNTITFHHVTFDAHNITTTIVGTLKMSGNLLMAGTTPSPPQSLSGGTIEVQQGNVTTSSFGTTGSTVIKLTGVNQTFNSAASNGSVPSLNISTTTGTTVLTGTFNIQNGYEHISGTVDASGSTINLGAGPFTPGTTAFNNLMFSGYANTITFSGTATVNGTLTLNGTSTSPPPNLNGGTIEVKGNFALSGFGYQGNTLIRMSGTSPQTITGDASTARSLPPFEIASSSTVTMTGFLGFEYGFTHVSGTVNASGSTAVFSNYTVTPNTMMFGNVVLSGYVTTATIVGTLNVGGKLSLSGSSWSPPATFNGGSIYAYGDIEVTGAGVQGSTAVSMVGSSNARINSNGANFPSPAFTINKSGGATISLDNNFTKSTISLLNGTIDMNGKNLTCTSLSLNGNTVTKNAGVLTVNGSVAGTGSLYGGTVNP